MERTSHNIKKERLSLYLLIKRSEDDKIAIEEIIDNESHNLLIDPKNLEYMGRAFKFINEPPYRPETNEAYEIQWQQQKKLIFPENIRTKKQNPLSLSINEKLLQEIAEINERDIGLKICSSKTKLSKDELYILLFRPVIKNFIPLGELNAMKDPDIGWAFGINLHNRAENRGIVMNAKRDSCENRDEPKRVEDEFTIIGFSPWVGSELLNVARDLEFKLRNLVKKDEMKDIIEKQKEDFEKNYISYKGALGAWGLIAALLTVALTVIMLIIRDLLGVVMVIEGVRQFTLKEIMEVSTLAGITIYVVSSGVRFVSKRLGISR